MTFNMFYGMFALMFFLHLQCVIPADKIRKSKAYRGYGYGSDPVPFGPAPNMLSLLCHYCNIFPDHPCRYRFCQRVPGFTGYAGRIGFYGLDWYNPDPHDVLCYYCGFFGDMYCLVNFGCWR